MITLAFSHSFTVGGLWGHALVCGDMFLKSPQCDYSFFLVPITYTEQ